MPNDDRGPSPIEPSAPPGTAPVAADPADAPTLHVPAAALPILQAAKAPVEKRPALSTTASALLTAHATAAAPLAVDGGASPATRAEHAPRLHSVSKRSPFGALLSRTLPAYTGPFAVGVADVEVPVHQETFGTFTHRSIPNKTAGLSLETALFTLFYPCERPEKETPVMWFPNMRQTIDGFLKMAKRTPNLWYRSVAYPLAAGAISGTTFPGNKDAPLLPAERAPARFGGRWPLMLFSHGVGCSRLMYSAFAGEMASRGYVVAVIEHRDGTSPSSRIAAKDGTKSSVDWIDWTDLTWPNLEEQPKDDTILRHVQIDLRCAELRAALDVMSMIARGEDVKRSSLDAPSFDWSRWTSVATERPVIAGHSLGGSAALAFSARTAAGALRLPHGTACGSVVVFDPATQRLAPWTQTLPHPLLVVNSEEFVVGAEYAIFAEQVAGTCTHPSGVPPSHSPTADGPDDGAPLVFSIPGATHPSFSDVFLILPETVNRLTGLRVRADKVLELAVAATTDFLAGDGYRIVGRAVRFEPEPPQRGTLDVEEGKGGENKGEVPMPWKPVGTPGDIVWHPF